MQNQREDKQEHSLWFHGLADLRMTFHSFSAHYRKVGPRWAYPVHDHPMFELNLVLSGCQRVLWDGEERLLGPGELFLMKPGEKHSCSASGDSDMSYSCIHFTMDDPNIRQALLSIRDTLHGESSPLAIAVGPVLRRISETGTGEQEYSADKGSHFDMMLVSFDLLGRLCTLLRDPPEGLLGDPQGAGGLAMQLARRIEKAVSDEPGMDDDEFGRQGIARIAHELGYSPAYCNRVFKNVYGISPRHFLSSIKLRQAKLLLMNKKLTVERIAERLGYKDVSQFSKQFKRWMNISPTQYRQLTE